MVASDVGEPVWRVLSLLGIVVNMYLAFWLHVAILPTPTHKTVL